MADNLAISEAEMMEEFRPQYDAYEYFSRTAITINGITTVLKFLLFVVVLAADIFLVVTVCKNEKLKCKTSSYLIHFGVINIIAIVITPIFLLLMYLLSIDGMGGVFWYYCVDIPIESAALSMCFLIGVCLCFDRLFETYNPDWKKKIEWLYRYSVILVYIIGIFKMVLTVGNCFDTKEHPWILSYIYGLTLIFNIIVNILNYREKPTPQKRSYSLAAANVIILSWFPMLIYEVLQNCFKGKRLMEDILTLVGFIPEWMGYASPIILLFVLGRVNKDFRKAYIRILKRKRSQDYGDEDDLDESCDGKDTVPPNNQIP